MLQQIHRCIFVVMYNCRSFRYNVDECWCRTTTSLLVFVQRPHCQFNHDKLGVPSNTASAPNFSSMHSNKRPDHPYVSWSVVNYNGVSLIAASMHHFILRVTLSIWQPTCFYPRLITKIPTSVGVFNIFSHLRVETPSKISWIKLVGINSAFEGSRPGTRK